MIMFERRGEARNWHRANLARDIFMGVLLAAGAVLLFPFTLLALLLGGMGALNGPPVPQQ